MLRNVIRTALAAIVTFAGLPPAFATDIACDAAVRSAPTRCNDPSAIAGNCSPESDTRPVGTRLICEYAMLSNAYDRIYAEQEQLANSGKITGAELSAWRDRRDKCADVSCVDALFAEWNQRSQRSSNSVTKTSSPTTSTPAAGHQMTSTPAAIEPGTSESAKRAPMTAQDEVGAQTPVASANSKPTDSNNPAGGLFLFGAIGIGIARALTPKKDGRYTTGYKNNRTLPKIVPVIYALSGLVILLAFFAGR